MLNIRSILFLIAERLTLPATWYGCSFLHSWICFSSSLSVGSLFFLAFITAAKVYCSSSSCSGCHLNLPPTTVFFVFFFSRENRMELLLVIYKKFHTTKPYHRSGPFHFGLPPPHELEGLVQTKFTIFTFKIEKKPYRRGKCIQYEIQTRGDHIHFCSVITNQWSRLKTLPGSKLYAASSSSELGLYITRGTASSSALSGSSKNSKSVWTVSSAVSVSGRTRCGTATRSEKYDKPSIHCIWVLRF